MCQYESLLVWKFWRYRWQISNDAPTVGLQVVVYNLESIPRLGIDETFFLNRFLQKWYRICFRFKFKVGFLDIIWEWFWISREFRQNTHHLDTSNIDASLIDTFLVSWQIDNFAIIMNIFNAEKVTHENKIQNSGRSPSVFSGHRTQKTRHYVEKLTYYLKLGLQCIHQVSKFLQN